MVQNGGFEVRLTAHSEDLGGDHFWTPHIPPLRNAHSGGTYLMGRLGGVRQVIFLMCSGQGMAPSICLSYVSYY